VGESEHPQEPKLNRSLGRLALTWYGVGAIVGGGFYALVGKVVGLAGLYAPVAYLTAASIAFLRALSFGELASRYPFSAGESYYVQEAFARRWLSTLTGWLVISTGVVSAATLARAFAGFGRELGIFAWDDAGVIVAIVVAMGLVAAAGIGESAALVGAITVVEVGGLVWILFVAGGSLGQLPERLPELIPSASAADWSGIFSGAFLCFYGFVGFEDMVNLAEEVRRPKRNVPKAILLALGLTAALYIAVTLAAILTLPQDRLEASDAPLSELLTGSGSRFAMTVIAMLAGVNGALVQIVMASRIVYGMAERGQSPAVFARINGRTQTPLEATAVCSALVLVLALWFPLVTLAEVTSAILLGVFALVNLALWKIKGQTAPPPGSVNHPRAVPLAGFLFSAALLALRAA